MANVKCPSCKRYITAVCGRCGGDTSGGRCRGCKAESTGSVRCNCGKSFSIAGSQWREVGGTFFNKAAFLLVGGAFVVIAAIIGIFLLLNFLIPKTIVITGQETVTINTEANFSVSARNFIGGTVSAWELTEYSFEVYGENKVDAIITGIEPLEGQFPRMTFKATSIGTIQIIFKADGKATKPFTITVIEPIIRIGLGSLGTSQVRQGGTLHLEAIHTFSHSIGYGLEWVTFDAIPTWAGTVNVSITKGDENLVTIRADSNSALGTVKLVAKYYCKILEKTIDSTPLTITIIRP
jgi:hypothetical protein